MSGSVRPGLGARVIIGLILSVAILVSGARPVFAASLERIGEHDRFATCAAIAREAFDPTGDRTWPGVTDVVIANGEDRAVPDSLAASGLCGVLDAPLLLVSSRGVPSAVKQVIQEMRAANGPLVLHIAGGDAVVPSSVVAELEALCGRAAWYLPDEIYACDRYDTAAGICKRIWVNNLGVMSTVFIANGAEPDRFVDSMSIAAVAAAEGYPVLFVRRDSIPAVTLYELENRGVNEGHPFTRAIILGGPVAVSDDVFDRIDAIPHITAERWAGADRYKTAVDIANKAIYEGWVSAGTVGLASTMPDGLSSGPMLGRANGVFMPTASALLPGPICTWLGSRKATVTDCYVFGENDVVSDAVYTEVRDVLD